MACSIIVSCKKHYSPTDEFIHPTKFELINRKTSKTAKAYCTAWSKVLALPTLRCGGGNRDQSGAHLPRYHQQLGTLRRYSSRPVFLSIPIFRIRPPAQSFHRLRRHQRWTRSSPESEEGWNHYQKALKEEFQLWYGAEDAWHALCRAIQIKPLPKTCQECEKVRVTQDIQHLAATYNSQGRWKEVEELHMRVLESTIRVLVERHPDTLTSMADLATTGFGAEGSGQV